MPTCKLEAAVKAIKVCVIVPRFNDFDTSHNESSNPISRNGGSQGQSFPINSSLRFENSFNIFFLDILKVLF